MKTALLVCDDMPTIVDRARTFRGAGFEIVACEGPSSHECPRYWDQPCVLRDAADVAIIEISAEPGTEPVDRICTATDGVHGTVVVGGAAAEERGRVALNVPFCESELLLAAAVSYIEAAFLKNRGPVSSLWKDGL